MRGGGEDVSVAQGRIAGPRRMRDHRVESAAADLEAIHDSKVRRGKGVDGVIGEARKDHIAVIKFVVESRSVGIVVLYFVRADCEVWRAGRGRRIRRRREQLQVGQSEWVDSVDEIWPR